MSRRLRVAIGAEIRLARQQAGLAIRFVATAVGCSPATLSRVERGLVVGVSVDLLVRAAGAVGLDLVVRAYPGGEPLRDAPQTALLGALRPRVHASVRWAVEVGLPIPGDRRRWDVVLDGPGWRVAVEAETAPRDWQALAGRIGLKQRDGAMPRVIVLLPDSRRTRAFLEAAAPLIPDMFPIPPRIALARLERGEDPGGNAIVVLRARTARRGRREADVAGGIPTGARSSARAPRVSRAIPTSTVRVHRARGGNETRDGDDEWVDLRSLISEEKRR